MGNKDLLVEDVMTFDPLVVVVGASIEEADIALRSTYVMGLPVVDSYGALVGVITHANLAFYRFHRAPSSEQDQKDARVPAAV
jgi:CBS domain-containing protein